MTKPIPWPVERLVAQLGRWSTSRGPLYLLLAERLRELIDSGQLPPRAALPPDRVLAEQLAVGRSTVVAAYDHLRAERKLERQQGRGTWVASAVLSGVQPSAVGTANPLFLNYLEPADTATPLACAAPSGPPPELIDAYRRALATLPGPDGGDIGYHPLGHPALRMGLARRYTEHGLPTGPEQILVTTGGQQALALIARLFLGPGDPVLVQGPTYPGALEVFRDAAAVIRSVTTTVDGVDPTQWTATLDSTRPRLAYLNPTNHNPTGGTLPVLARRRLVEVTVARGIPLIADTVLDGLSFRDTEPPGLAELVDTGTVLTVGSFSKTVWGGVRTGWIRGATEDIARLSRIKTVHDLGSAVLEQLALAELLPRLDAVAAARVTRLRQRHDQLCARLRDALPDWRFEPAGGGQCLWVRLPCGDASAFAQVALRHGVTVLPGTALDATGGSTEYLRIPFTAPVAELTESVRRLALAWPAYQRTGQAPAAVHALVV
ncbi:PLP-dependent aminotransferase family protein [Amycolatopsis cihanbeyliensis]|uniref:DNA-binding transcriptional MocR family regulator n=1 Tax=Amycolatopsis cihanbeyliensis TaxID=1128664 RepID=A0A542DD31_AMYCI|nr:PLP-dependent aminotransferase family protein [Amycolatopsis cihanbeyliensis]TQJ00966.1 DNA-binding transcriptional MocR family regulator [Amycolatopsis cihanbeyliensis]